ncbi:SusC/RagA family TonB-linked outer membrane protein [Chryseobacterium limigenitum]|uniref:TonB-linked outer membrane protein, SusC/RagA family n=1 Tax=Chryseobacterium limigenitum TaxID=1612149 RepID=A0A1K2IJQ5_9FLAO|nr:SusC/RagA family TonB-linked outer membrane protein [Chryseobacterium limigenitum]SFZ92623.1 TonB-linked outer membrane protein, SusC/RagA family [Chryseobacterium limigenitum]
MNVKLRVITTGVLFFTGQFVMAQKAKNDTVTKEHKIEEVVMVGFGQKKTVQELTGAVGTMKSDAIKDVPVASVDKMLQGRISGVQTGNASGQPGGFASVRIRGIASVNGGVNPIYIVDGIRVQSGDLTSGATTANILANLNNDDIESITVLKDASSTAVYGADAGAGVIVITTKSGKKGKPKISLNFESGTNSRAISGLEGLNTEQYRHLLNYSIANAYGFDPTEVSTMASQGSWPTGTFTTGTIATLKNIYTTNNDTNWRDVTTRSGYQNSINASISGGNDKITYYNSANYFLQESELKGSDFKRLGFTSKVDYEASDRLKMGTDIQLSYSRINTLPNGGGFANPILFELFARPTDPAYNADGTYYLGTAGRLSNNLFNSGYTQENNYFRASTARVFGNIYGEYKILKNLSYRMVFGAELNNIENDTYYNPIHGDGYQVNGRKTESTGRYFNWNFQNIINYNFKFGEKNRFNISAIQEAYQRNFRFVAGQGVNVGSPNLETLSNFIKPIYARGERSKSSRNGYAAIFNYDYDKLILIDASLRKDALSNFTEGQKWGTFYSVGAGIDLARLQFVKDWNEISQFKLRASYGKVGNTISSTPYSLYEYTLNYNDLPAGTMKYVYNPDLHWETVKPLSLGVDLGFFKNRLKVTAEYYSKKTEDLVFSVPLQISQGLPIPSDSDQTYPFMDINVGSLVNKGFEFTVNYDIIRKDELTLSIGGNLSTLKNEITSLYGGQDIIIGSTILKEGEGIGTFYMRKWAGVDPTNGDPLWYKNGVDGETTNKYADADVAVQGRAFSNLFGGVNINTSYKNFTLSALGTFGFGGQVLNNWGAYTQSDGQYTYSYPGSTDALDFWTPSNPNAANPKPIYGNATSSNRTSTRYLAKTDYLRLSNIRVGYRFDAKMLRGTGMQGFEVYVQGNNIWTHRYDKNLRFDPENNLNTTNNLNLPVQKTYSIGFNIQF